MDRFALVVVDPQRAFTDPGATIGREVGAAQFRVITETVARLASFAADHHGPKIWVRAEYEPGQFTGGDLRHPFAGLCVPDAPDAGWDPGLTPPADALVITKTSMDANDVPAFVDATQAWIGTVDAVLITGFWLTSCVAATAISCAHRLAHRLPVVVPLSLCATRSGQYDPEDTHAEAVDVNRQLERMRLNGVTVCAQPDDWRSTPSAATTG